VNQPALATAAQPVHIVWQAPDGTQVQDCHPRDLVELVARREGTLWVHLDASVAAQHALLEKLFRFHPLAIEDTLNPSTRVKVEEYDGYLFAVMRGVRLDEETEDPYDLVTHDLHAFLGDGGACHAAAGPLAGTAGAWSRSGTARAARRLHRRVFPDSRAG
jgi:magnesium transporter